MSRETIMLTMDFPDEIEETIDKMEVIAAYLRRGGFTGELYYEAINTRIVFTEKAIILKEYYEQKKAKDNS